MSKITYKHISISGLVAEYIVAIDVTRIRFPADAYARGFPFCSQRVMRAAAPWIVCCMCAQSVTPCWLVASCRGPGA